MKEFYLAGYDVSGIQNFIFNSPVLKEIIGASHIVHNVLDKTLPKVIEEYGKQHNLKVRVKWKENENPLDFLMLEDDDLAAEVVYIGGGNAYVAYRSKEIGIEITKIFSKTVYEETESLFIAVGFVHVRPEDDLREVFGNKLPRVLNQNKASMLRTKPLLNIAITRQDISTGHPVIEKNNDEYLTRDRKLKLTVYKNEIDKIFNKLLPDNSAKKYEFIREFDDLILEKGEDSFIGVVHIDGNNMGDTIHKIMNEANLSMNEYVKKIRKISDAITQAYVKAFKVMTNHLAEYLQTNNQNYEKTMLPLRPIIVNGDDITFVCQARLALSLVEIFLKEINKNKLDDKYPLSACAGIFYCRSHYPFHLAYELSEQACRNAKYKAKAHAKKYNCSIKSWVDFAISYQGMTNSLNNVRERTYNLPELGEVVMFSTEDSSYKGYNLLNRPYLVSDESQGKVFELAFFKDLMKYLTKSKDRWPNSKLKELRNAFLVSSVLVEKLLRENQARGRVLYKGKYKLHEALLRGFFEVQKYTPFFDVLEMLDLYEDVGGVNNED